MMQHFTKYEIARIIGARALQIAMDAPMLLKFSDEELKVMRFDPLKIAQRELDEGVLPISIHRPLPKRRHEKLKEVRNEDIDDEKIIEKEKEIEEEITEKAVEEGFAAEDEWKRSFAEIVNFEEQLNKHGIILLKFWVHIDKDEQRQRFELRQKTSYKHYKITDEDFRNRERWNDYEIAANEMIERTGTEFAPWHLIEANDKKFARIKTLKIFCDRLKKMV